MPAFPASFPVVFAALVCLVPAGCRAGAQPADAASRVVPPPVAKPASAAVGVPVGFAQFPSISPDGATIVFTWDGDLWSVAADGTAAATRLTAHPALERRSAFSPDGKWLAFESDREGARNIYVMPVSPGAGPGALVTGPIRRVTTSEKAQNLSSFSADGREIYFTSTQEPAIYRSTRMFRVAVPSGDGEERQAPVSRLADCFGGMPHPAVDGSFITFTRGRYDFTRPAYRGTGAMDIARLNGAGDPNQTVQLLTASNCSDGDAFPLADGSVVFVSSRDGQNNIWKLPVGKTDADAAAMTKLTNFGPINAGGVATVSVGHGVRDFAVSPSGRWGVFLVWDTMYRIDLSVGAPGGGGATVVPLVASADAADLDFQRLSLDRNVSEAALSPDGKTMAVIARGEVFVRSTEENRPTRRVTDTIGRERDLAWSPDGKTLYFTSDDTGRYAIYAATVTLSREDIAPKKDDDKHEDKADDRPKDEPARDGAADPAKEPAAEAVKAKKPAEKKPATPDFGKRWADSLRFNVEKTISSDGLDERRPLVSPDGKRMMWVHGLGDLIIRDLATGKDRTVLTGWNEPEALWMPDSRHIVFAREDLDYNSDIWILDADPAAADNAAAPTPVNITRHPDNDVSPRLSADGKVLYFLSERARESDEFDVFAVNLDKRLDGLRPYELDEYFKKAAEAAKKAKPLGAPEKAADKPADKPKKDDAEKKDDADKPEGGEPKADAKPEPKPEAKKKPEPLKLDLDDAYLRIRRITTLPGNEGDLACTPGGERVVFSGDNDGKRAFLSVDFKGEDRKSLDSGEPGGVGVSLTGDKVSFVKGGQAYLVPPAGGKVESMPIDAPVVIDVAKQQRQKFIEAARLLGDRFYHPTLKGLNWPMLTERYVALAERTRTTDEFNRVTNLLWGELDGSHLGTMGGPGFSAPSPAVGYLGADLKAVPGGYQVTRIIRAGPADRDSSRLKVGDVISAIDGKPLATGPDAMPSLDTSVALAGRAGKETLIELRMAAPVGAPAEPAPSNAGRYVLLTSVSGGENDNLRYDDEVESRRAKVDELSGGKLGYLHIRGMSEPYVRDFERDLYAAANGKLGLIIDVRDNGGGSTADILLSSLTAPRHAWTMPRGVDPKAVPQDSYPRDRRLIYGWTRPINVLINENSFSNAEIFAHAIKTIGRGKLIGTATYGGVISTGAATLIDGTLVRTPFRGWYLPDGTDMENHGAQPDVSVPQTPEDEIAARDRQLEAAVTELLGRVGG